MPDGTLLQRPAPDSTDATQPLDSFTSALIAADINAGSADYASALSWLDIAEVLEGELPPVYMAKRQAWASVVAAERGWLQERA